jgi:hypothetical protein
VPSRRPHHWTKYRRRPHCPSISSPFVGLYLVADDLADIGVLALLDEGGIVEALVIELDLVLRLGCLTRLLLACASSSASSRETKWGSWV